MRLRDGLMVVVCGVLLASVACAVGSGDSASTAGATTTDGTTAGDTGATTGVPIVTVSTTPQTGGAAPGDANTLVPQIVTGLARYTLIGRFVTTNPNNIIFGLIASRIGVRFTGTSLTMMMFDSGTDYFDVDIDGQKQTTPVMVSKSAAPVAYVLAQNLQSGTHTLWLTKRTETMQNSANNLGIAHLTDMVLDANENFMTPPQKKTRRIEFVGDSGFSGYGVEAIVGAPGTSNCNYSAATQNGSKSIPGMTAAFLDADQVDATVTAKGVYLSFYDPTNKSHTFPVLYEMIFPPAGPAYAFDATGTDAVVLSVGGDDLWGSNGNGYFPNPDAPDNGSPASPQNPNGSDPNFFINAMSDYLVQINGHYPGVLIVCVLSASAKNNDTLSLGSGLQKAIALAQTKGVPNAVYYSYFTGDPTYHTYDDIAQGLKFYYGCDYHPSALGSQWLGQRLATFIAAQKGWPAPPATL